MTLIEVQISAAISVVIIGVVITLTIYTGNMFATMGGYVWMESSARRATDMLLRDIRQAKALTAFATNSLAFTDWDGQPLQIRHNASARTVERIKAGVTDPILKDCDSLAFTMFKAGVTNGSFNAYTTDVVGECKMIQVDWACSRPMSTSKSSLTNVSTFKVTLRPK